MEPERRNVVKKKKILTEVFVLFFIAAVFMAVYVVIEMGNDWLAVLGGAVVLLIASYLLIDYRLESRVEKENEGKEGAEEVLKAIYTVVKRGSNENTELLQKIDLHLEEMTQVLERMERAATSGADETSQARLEVQQFSSDTAEAVKGLRQDYQTGVKNLIKYEKENAKQIAEAARTNTEMTIMELGAQLTKIQEQLQAQGSAVAMMPFSPVSAPNDMFEPDNEEDDDELLPVLDDAKYAENQEPSGASDADVMGDDFDPEAAIKAYMIEQGYVDVEETEAVAEEPEIEEIPVPEPIEEPAPQKSEEEIASTLQSMASGDPNRALTPEEIAAMFAAIQ